MIEQKKQIKCAMCRKDLNGADFIHKITFGCTSQYGYNEIEQAQICTACSLVVRRTMGLMKGVMAE